MELKSTTNGFVTSTTGGLRTDALDSSHARYVVISGFPKLSGRECLDSVANAASDYEAADRREASGAIELSYIANPS
jgi:hypothetical protein